MTTPSADDRGTMITIARCEGRELFLEALGRSPEYAATLGVQRAAPSAQSAAPATITVTGGAAP